jgi:hypothetical protein
MFLRDPVSPLPIPIAGKQMTLTEKGYSTDELFDIIVDYPESLSALEDLKVC